MQERHTDRHRYFKELAETSEQYYIPYIEQFMSLKAGMRVLEIGAGEGGNLLPFARRGLRVTGVEIVAQRVEQARSFFAAEGVEGEFVNRDIFETYDLLTGPYDLVICHDVIEHIPFKDRFMVRVSQLLSSTGLAFIGFPAWQMPFGGHQQICRSRFCSHAPFIHLLPNPIYRGVLRMGGLSRKEIDEMLDIKACRMTIENFERVARRNGLQIVNRQMWFINPHYKIKFGLKPRRLWRAIGAIPYVRDFFSTSVFYMLRIDESQLDA